MALVPPCKPGMCTFAPTLALPGQKPRPEGPPSGGSEGLGRAGGREAGSSGTSFRKRT